MRRLIIMLAALLIALPCSAQQVFGPFRDANQTIHVTFNTVDPTSGAATAVGGVTDGATDAFEIYDTSSVTQIAGADTFTENFDGVTGYHRVAIDLNTAVFADGLYDVVVSDADATAGTTALTGRKVASFRIEASPPGINETGGRVFYLDSVTDGAGDSGSRGAPFDSWAQALAIIGNGDEVVFLATYSGQIDMTTKKGITIRGVDESIAIGHTDSVVLLCDNATVKNLTLTATTTGAGISGINVGSTITIENVTASGPSQGVLVLPTSDASDRSCRVVMRNVRVLSPLDALTVASAFVDAENCDFISTQTATPGSRAVYIYNGPGTYPAYGRFVNCNATSTRGAAFAGTSSFTSRAIQAGGNSTNGRVNVSWIGGQITATASSATDTGFVYAVAAEPNSSSASAQVEVTGAIVTTSMAGAGTNQSARGAGTTGFVRYDRTTIDTTKFSGNVSSGLSPTTAGRTLDVAATGEAGLDFNNINDAGSAHTLTNITVPLVTTTTTATTATNVTNLPAFPSAWQAPVESEMNDALVAQNLDHLVKIAVDTNFAATVHADSVIGQLADNGAGFDRSTDSLEAIRDNMSAGSGITASDVWNYAGAGGRTLSSAGVDAIGAEFDEHLASTEITLTPAAITAIGAGVRTELAVELGRIDVATSSRLAPTAAGRTLDVSTGGEAGLDWANIGSPTSTVALTNTTVGTVTTTTTATNLTNLPAIPTNWITGAGITDGAITNAELATDGSEFTAIPWNTASWDANAQREVNEALADQNLDHLVKSAVDTSFAVTVQANSVIGQLADNGAGFDRTTDSLETIRDNMGTPQTGDSFARLGAPVGGSISADIAAVHSRIGPPVTGSISSDIAAVAGQTDDIGVGGAGLTAIPWNAAWDTDAQSEAADALAAIFLDKLFAADYDPASKPGVGTALLNELIESDSGVSRYTANALEQAPTGAGGGGATPAQIWDYLTTNATLSGSMGKLIVDNLDAKVSTRLASSAYTPQTGDSYARLGAPVGGSISADIAAVKGYVDDIGTAGAGLTAVPWNSSFGTPQTGDAFARLGAPANGSVSADIAAVENQTDDIGVEGAGLTALPWNNSIWDTEVQSEVSDALNAIFLDKLFAADYNPASKPGIGTALLNELIESDSGVSRYTANALEQAPVGSGGGGATPAQIWDYLTTNATLSGSMGKLIVDNLDAKISTRLASSAYVAPDSAATIASAVRTNLAVELGRIDVATSSRIAPLTPGRNLLVDAGGHVGIDWANIANPTADQNLSSTTIESSGTPLTPEQIATAVWAHVTRTITDKTGFSITQPFPTNFEDLFVEDGTGKVLTDVTMTQDNIDDIVQGIEDSSTSTDVNIETVPTSRVFELIPQEDDDDLVSENQKNISIGTPGRIYAVDFENDASTNQKIYSVQAPTITSGTVGGVTFGTPGKEGTQAKFSITGVTQGTYRVRVEGRYDSPGGAPFRGDILIKVVP